MHLDPPLFAKAHDGQLGFDGRYVTITRAGFFARSAHGRSEKRLHVSQISAVQWKRPGMTPGFIEFTVSGGSESHARTSQQLSGKHKNENSMVVLKKSEVDVLAIRDAVEKAIAEQHQAPTPANDMAAQLRQLGELHTAGVLSDAEFTAAKARLLG